MKKILYVVLASLLLFSCEDALVESPKSLAVETFYNTTAEVEAAISAIYTPLRDQGCMGGLYPTQLECYTDYGYGRGSHAVLSNFQGLDGTNQSRIGTFWDKFYLSIRNANIVIKNAPNGSKLTQADIAKYVAEAKFLRAFTYFHLVRNWGGVPVRTEENMTIQNIKRNSADEVYNLIYSDLQFAESNLPDNPSIAGKPTKWSAKTLLADVYFFQGKNAEARDKAKEVILSNKFSLVPVTVADDFQKIFGPDVITNSEEIFYLKFSRLGNAQGFGYLMYLNHPGTKYYGGGGYYTVYSTTSNSVIAAWDKNDLRYSATWYPYNIGLGSNTILTKKFVDPLAPNANGAGNDYPLYRYADVLLLYAEADCRASGSVSADAMEKLNMVHRRAYGKSSVVADASVDFKVSDYTKDTFINLAIRERGYETQFEAKRWHDLKRTGKVKEIIKTATGKDVAEKHLLWPIPVSELNYNTAIDPAKDQNPGY
jgi:SusD family.